MFDDIDLGSGYNDAGASSVYDGGGGYGDLSGDTGTALGGGYDSSGIGNFYDGSDVGSGGLGALYQALSGLTNTDAGSSQVGLADNSGVKYDTGGQTQDTFKAENPYGAQSKIGDAATDKKSPLSGMFGHKENGDIDWTDGKTVTSLLKGLGMGGNLLTQILNKNKQANSQTAAQLQAQLPQSQYNKWSPTQQQWADSYFNQAYTPPAQREKLYAADMQSPIRATKGYAEGGEVDGMGGGMGGAPLDHPLGLIQSETSGQADDVPVMLSGGEYVISADVVAALGDGNNEAGAKKLDELVQSIRAKHRSTGPEELPPLSSHPLEHLGMEE